MVAFVKCILVIVISTVCLVETSKKGGLRIIDGYDVDSKIYPYVGRIDSIKQFYNSEEEVARSPVCTGAFLTPVDFLTAAHCFGAFRLSETEKWAVAYDFTHGNDEDNSYSLIHSYKKHPTYLNDKYGLQNDIAVAKTDKTTLERYAKLSAVDYKSLMGVEATAFGYGTANHGDILGSSNQLNKTLQAINVIISLCPIERRANDYPVICLSGKCGKKQSICWGDSGGPVIHGSGVIAINTATYVRNCQLEYYKKDKKAQYTAGIVTPMSPYINWISRVVKKKQ